jgi:hypothetical protein
MHSHIAGRDGRTRAIQKAERSSCRAQTKEALKNGNDSIAFEKRIKKTSSGYIDIQKSEKDMYEKIVSFKKSIINGNICCTTFNQKSAIDSYLVDLMIQKDDSYTKKERTAQEINDLYKDYYLKALATLSDDELKSIVHKVYKRKGA